MVKDPPAVGVVALLLSPSSNTALRLTLSISRHKGHENRNTHVPFASNLTNLYSNAVEAGKFNVVLQVGYPYAVIGIAALAPHEPSCEILPTTRTLSKAQ